MSSDVPPHRLTTHLCATTIQAKVQELAQAIDHDYAGQPLTVVAVLKGAFVFMADLTRALQTPINRIELIRLASYGSGTTSQGVQVLTDIEPAAIAQKHVLLVEDIVDTGRSTTKALELLRQHQPASVKLCSLLDKPDRRIMPVEIDYLGFTVPDEFIVGYGLDWDERYRNLPGIHTVEFH